MRTDDARQCKWAGGCERRLVPDNRWHGLTNAERKAYRDRGVYPHASRGLCASHARQAREDGTVLDYERRDVPADMVVEEWQRADLDPTLSKAARIRLMAPRLGMTEAALGKALERAGILEPQAAGLTHLRRPGTERECDQCRLSHVRTVRAEAEVRVCASRLADDPDSPSRQTALEAAHERLADAKAWQDMHHDMDHGEVAA